MKQVLIVLVVLGVAQGFGQSLSRGRIISKTAGQVVEEKCPNSTNGYERTCARQNQSETKKNKMHWNVKSEKGFLAKYPLGTNEFGRTFAQQAEYEEKFDMKSFLGFEFGRVYSDSEWFVLHQLDKPFRKFTKARLNPTGRGRLMRVMLDENFYGVSYESLSNEVDEITFLLAKKYELSYDDYSPKGVYGYHFLTPNVSIEVYADFGNLAGSATLRVWIENWRVFNEEEKHSRSKTARATGVTADAVSMAEDPSMSRGERLFNEKNPSGTNACGRTYVQQKEFEKAESERAEKERELWNSWTNLLPDDNALNQIVRRAEEKFNCVFIGYFGCTNTWQAGQGKSLIFRGSNTIRKLDPDGRIVRVSTMENGDVEELCFVDTEKERVLESMREKFAQEHGMTLAEAKEKYAKWKSVNGNGRRSLSSGLQRPGLFGGSLRARRLQRQQGL